MKRGNGDDRWEGFGGHPQQDKNHNQREEAGRRTNSPGIPRANLQNVPFNEWDWAKNDPNFYRQFMSMAESKNAQQLNQVRWQRWNIATNN